MTLTHDDNPGQYPLLGLFLCLGEISECRSLSTSVLNIDASDFMSTTSIGNTRKVRWTNSPNICLNFLFPCSGTFHKLTIHPIERTGERGGVEDVRRGRCNRKEGTGLERPEKRKFRKCRR